MLNFSPMHNCVLYINFIHVFSIEKLSVQNVCIIFGSISLILSLECSITTAGVVSDTMWTDPEETIIVFSYSVVMWVTHYCKRKTWTIIMLNLMHLLS